MRPSFEMSWYEGFAQQTIDLSRSKFEVPTLDAAQQAADIKRKVTISNMCSESKLLINDIAKTLEETTLEELLSV